MDPRRRDYRKMQMYKNIMNDSYDFQNPDASTMEFIQKVSASTLGITNMTDIDSTICIVLDWVEKLIKIRQDEIARLQANDIMKKGTFVDDKPLIPQKKVPVPKSLQSYDSNESNRINDPTSLHDVDQLLASLENEMHASPSVHTDSQTPTQTSKHVTFDDDNDNFLLEPEEIVKGAINESNVMSLQMNHNTLESMNNTERVESIRKKLEDLRRIVKSM